MASLVRTSQDRPRRQTVPVVGVGAGVVMAPGPEEPGMPYEVGQEGKEGISGASRGSSVPRDGGDRAGNRAAGESGPPSPPGREAAGVWNLVECCSVDV